MVTDIKTARRGFLKFVGIFILKIVILKTMTVLQENGILSDNTLIDISPR